MNVLLVTTWDTACGIAEHSSMLKEYVERADPEIHLHPMPAALDPHSVDDQPLGYYDLLHLNYHAALHSRWTPKAVATARNVYKKVVITYHDTIRRRGPLAVQHLVARVVAFPNDLARFHVNG